MSESDGLNYKAMAQNAMRQVVRDALKQTAEHGLPGAHHFYISFRTKADGVDIDESLVAKFPEEMTIVLEHQYWDLDADEDGFEVTLRFNGIPKYLRIPYAAITVFHDPSVQFALQFDHDEAVDAKATSSAPVKSAADTEAEDEGAEPEKGTVVSLDAFRKKDG